MNKSKLLHYKRKGLPRHSAAKKGLPRRSAAKTGAILPLVMVAIVLLLAMGTGLLSLGWHSRVYAIRSNTDIEARCAVDAGFTKALLQMNRKLAIKPWNDSNLPAGTNEELPNCDAIYSYAVTTNSHSVWDEDEHGIGASPTGYYVHSRGQSDQAVRSALGTLGLKALFDHAIFVQGDLSLKAGTTVDGYNSSDPSITDVELRIGTNSTDLHSVILNMGVTVDGDVLIGPGGVAGDVVQNLGATVNGGTYNIAETLPIEPVTAPVLSPMGKISIHGGTQVIGPADSGRYSTISIKRAADAGVLAVDGGDVVLHVTGAIDLGQDCEIAIRPDATLVLYLDGDLRAANNAGINNQNNQIPGTFRLYGTGSDQRLTLMAKSETLGAVYAPNADVTIMAMGDVRGAVTARNFTMNAGGNFYYDEALRETAIDDDHVRFTITKWVEW